MAEQRNNRAGGIPAQSSLPKPQVAQAEELSGVVAGQAEEVKEVEKLKSEGPFTVVALRPGFFGHQRRKTGDVFKV